MNWFDYSLIGAFVLFIVIALNLVVEFRQESAKCFANPMQYAFQKADKSINSTIQCSCTFVKDREVYSFSLSEFGAIDFGENISQNKSFVQYFNFSLPS